MARLFLARPVLAVVCSLLIVLVGVIALAGLPIAQYPQITPPSVNLQAVYVGASAEVVEESVAQPIEQQVNGVEGMEYMSSLSSSDGYYSLTVTFGLERDGDIAAVQVQNRASQASASLPSEVLDAGVSVSKTTPDTLMFFVLYSPEGTYDELFLKNYGSINVVEVLKRAKGVGTVNEYGSDFGMRIWLRPDRMARLGITAGDVARAVREQHAQAPAGQVGQYPAPPGQAFQYTVQVRGRLVTEAEFADLVVRALPDGSAVRIRDIGRVELGAREYRYFGTYNGRPAAVFSISLTPEASAIETAGIVRRELDDISSRFPADVAYAVVVDNTVFVTRSLEEVLRTFAEALLLVLVVVFVFLQSWRATLIPMLAVPVSLVGTFAAFTVLGFSVNTLTLFAMVLAIGIVVDDAIVVVEAVEHHMRHSGLGPAAATSRALSEVQGPVVAIAVVLAAVFVPVAFLGGISGQFYQQFAVTVAVSVLLSAFVALSLTPVLCATLLRPAAAGGRRSLAGRLFGAFNAGFERTTEAYGRGVRLAIRGALATVLLLAAIGGATVWLFRTVPGAFVPDEDQGYFFGTVLLPEAAAIERTRAATVKVDDVVRGTRGVRSTVSVVGVDILTGTAQPNRSLLAVALEPWEARETPDLSVPAIMGAIQARVAGIAEAVVLTFPPPPIPGLGNTGGFQLMVEDRGSGTPQDLARVANDVIAAARRRPEIGSVYSTFTATTPAFRLEVDRDRARKLGVALTDVFTTLQAYLGGYQIGDFTRFGRTYKVTMQAEPGFRGGIEALAFFSVRSAGGDMVPVDTLVEPARSTAPAMLQRFNGYRSAQIGGSPARGVSSGEALAAMEAVAQQVLPPGYAYEWAGVSRQEKAAAGQAPIVLGLAVAFVFLVLAALYESWTVPFAVLLAVPLGAFGAMAALLVRGLSNDIYAQIGLVVLVGLAAKNAILIVEFARVRREAGMDAVEAAVEAARLRLRPILMTSFAFILGVVPLVVASGAGAAARNSLGTAVFGGMTAATLLAIFVVPVLFVVIDRLVARVTGRARLPAEPRPQPAD